MDYNFVPSVTQAFQYERYKFPKLHGFKISDEKSLHNDKKKILSYESHHSKLWEKAMHQSFKCNTFPATDTIRKSSASSAQIWAWVTFSTNVKSDMFSPFPIMNWNEKLCYFNKSRQRTSCIDHTNRYVFSIGLLWEDKTWLHQVNQY